METGVFHEHAVREIHLNVFQRKQSGLLQTSFFPIGIASFFL
jgi:hypothetical protein